MTADVSCKWQDTFNLPMLLRTGELERTVRTRMQPGPYSGCAPTSPVAGSANVHEAC